MKNKNQNLGFYSDDSADDEDLSERGFSIYEEGDEESEDFKDEEKDIDLEAADEEKEENYLFSDKSGAGSDLADDNPAPVFLRINKEDEESGEDEEAAGEAERKNEQEEMSSSVAISKTKIVLAKKLLENIRENNEKLINLFGGLISEEDERRIRISRLSEEVDLSEDNEEVNKIIEGVFDGENMIGPDGKQYSVPSNYASKSKLVEGDLLKLTITDRGTFVYKQTKPVERRRIVGVLEKEDDGSFTVLSNGKKRKVLTASITYFKGDVGDEVVILIPKESDSAWGAVENIIKKPI